jgi:hypothetical protein
MGAVAIGRVVFGRIVVGGVVSGCFANGCIVVGGVAIGCVASGCLYDKVRQSITEQKQKQKAWTNHKLGSNRSDRFRPKSEPVIGSWFLHLLLLVTL